MLRSFMTSESGAVTVDWVVLTSAVVGLGLASASVVRGGVASTAGEINQALCSTSVNPSFKSALTTDRFADGLACWTTTAETFDDPYLQGGSGLMLF